MVLWENRWTLIMCIDGCWCQLFSDVSWQMWCHLTMKAHINKDSQFILNPLLKWKPVKLVQKRCEVVWSSLIDLTCCCIEHNLKSITELPRSSECFESFWVLQNSRMPLSGLVLSWRHHSQGMYRGYEHKLLEQCFQTQCRSYWMESGIDDMRWSTTISPFCWHGVAGDVI